MILKRGCYYKVNVPRFGVGTITQYFKVVKLIRHKRDPMEVAIVSKLGGSTTPFYGKQYRKVSKLMDIVEIPKLLGLIKVGR